jgi:hypothetical protein
VYGGGLHKIEPKELLRMSSAPILEAFPELADDAEVADALSGRVTGQLDLR